MCIYVANISTLMIADKGLAPCNDELYIAVIISIMVNSRSTHNDKTLQVCSCTWLLGLTIPQKILDPPVHVISKIPD